MSADRRAVLDLPRDTRVRAAFDLSYRELSRLRRIAFRRLDLHPGLHLEAHAVAALAEVSIETDREDWKPLTMTVFSTKCARGR